MVDGECGCRGNKRVWIKEHLPRYRCSSGHDDAHVALRKVRCVQLNPTTLEMAMHSLSTTAAAMPPHLARTWTCEELLRGHATKKYALIIVNQPIRKDVLQRAWQAVDIKLCADGGANRLFDVDHENQFVALSPEVPYASYADTRQTRYLPDLIKGDLDSLRPDVQAHYASLKVPIKKDMDEYSTDLMKCIQEVPEDYALVLLGGLSGRVDQTVHTMSMLHKMEREIYVLDKESMAWVLRPVSKFT